MIEETSQPQSLPDQSNLVPLGLLVMEGLSTSIDALARVLGDKVTVDDAGLRCCTTETAQQLFAQKRARDVDEAEQRRIAKEQAQQDREERRRNDPVRALRRRLGNRPAGATLDTERMNSWM